MCVCSLRCFFFLAPLAAQPDRYGLPACSAPSQHLAQRARFILCFSDETKTPLWSAYELTPDTLAKPPLPRPKNFRPDPELASAQNTDYRHSGFHRGHVVPAADMSNDASALRDTFLLSNAVPQNPFLNSGKWAVLESHIRSLAASYDSLIVLTGPIFCESTTHIGPSQVAVPCELYKIVVATRGSELSIFAVILPNDHNPIEPVHHFTVQVSEVERRTHLNFFPTLPQSNLQIAGVSMMH